ncbi:MAG: preprotein translocase subunit SecG [Candidatus Aminicenantes bacterium]|nr:preprotein translocase subunit SecG [Candidatus Aminicenantes bacterium]
MGAILTTFHIIICFILIIAVLLQSGKAADLAGAFGGAGSQSVFGPRGAATILSKVTTICAVLFMITSFGLWMVSARGESSVVSGEEAPVQTPAAVTDQPADKQAQTGQPVTTEEQKKEDEKTAAAEQEKKDPKKPPAKKEEIKDPNQEIR